MVTEKRTRSLDIAKGILIILVVSGHAQTDLVHDIIFMFHMPLFFVISGFLMKREKLLRVGYARRKIKHLIVPYVLYLILDTLFVQKTISAHDWAYAIWGGRAITGVYWYTTCYIFALFILTILLKNSPDKIVKILILVGGGIAVFESYLVDGIHFLQFPGVPWNLDVSLMALIYIGIGFFYKKYINELLQSDLRRYDLIAGITVIVLIVFCCFIYQDGNRLYYFDMKPVYYKDLVLGIIIPCAFGIVLGRIVRFLSKIKCIDWLNGFLALCGRTTIPIMFMHIPLNHWKNTLVYGRCVYMIIGVGMPLVFTILFNRYKVMRNLFGLPDLQKSENKSYTQ